MYNIILSVYRCVHASVTCLGWRSEARFREPAVSFHQVQKELRSLGLAEVTFPD